MLSTVSWVAVDALRRREVLQLLEREYAQSLERHLRKLSTQFCNVQVLQPAKHQSAMGCSERAAGLQKPEVCSGGA